MKIFRFLLVVVLSAISLISLPVLVQASAWPTHAVKLIVPYPAARNADNVGRLGADRLSASLGQAVILENKGDAGGVIGTQAVARSPADGYLLLLAPSGVMTLTPPLRPVPCQLADFVPATTVAGSYGVIAARKDLPAKNMAELAALAKQKPGKLTYGSAGIGTATHIAAEYIHMGLGIKLLQVPYKGSSDTLTGPMAAQIDVMYDPIARPAVREGRPRALAVSGKHRHPELPNVPAFTEQRVTSTAPSWFEVLAPNGTPQAVVAQIAAAIEKSLSGAGVEKHLATMSRYPDFIASAAMTKAVQEESALYKDLLARTDIKTE